METLLIISCIAATILILPPTMILAGYAGRKMAEFWWNLLDMDRRMK